MMSENNMEKNYYEALEIETNASQREIANGYQRVKNAYSNDSPALYSLMSEDECREILESIEEAYSILSNPSKRRQYDIAHGLNKNSNVYTSNNQNELSQSPAALNENIASSNERCISKIVATKRFSLQYDINQELEQEIEQTTEFTGPFLQKIREYKNIDINRMAEMTKVSKTYLVNIESENINNLPALVYVRGFVYQYAKCLKLNPDLVATSYMFHLKKIKGDI